MAETDLEQGEKQARQRSLHIGMGLIFGKLQHDPSTVTTADACALADMAEEGDVYTAMVIEALAELAMYNEGDEAVPRGVGRAPASQVSRLVDDLHATVKASPQGITTKTVQTTRSILKMMERAIGHTKAPHPELEAELQQEYAKIVPKVERGVVTRTESENQDNGNTEGVGANDMSRPSLARRELLSSVLGTVRHRTNGCTSTSYKDSTHDTLPEPRPVHITTRKAHNDEGPVYVFRPKEQSSSEQSGRKSPKLSTRRCQSFGETANRTAGRDSDVISRAYRCEDTRTVA